METIIIQTKSKSNRKLLLELTKKIGEKALVLDKDIADDILFGKMMKEKKTGKLYKSPNETTIKAIKAAKQGKVTKYKNVDALLNKLGQSAI